MHNGGWNYRLVKKGKNVGVHEVYYTDGNPTSCTVNPVRIIGGKHGGIMWVIGKINEAARKPILNYKEIK